MLPFLQSNISLVVGALLVVGLLGARGASQDADLRRDLRGALVLLVAFLVLRTLAWFLPEGSPPGLARAVQVGWMLTFAFGVLRVAVALALRLVRLRTRVATPKILRDVVDFTLYALAAVPILKAELNLDLTGLLATSAVLSVVIGLALQDTLGNLFAGLSLQLEPPFQVGDFVRIGEHTGRVAQVAWRSTRIETFRNESITLPNAMVAKEAVKNFTRHGLPMGVDVFLTLSRDAPPNTVRTSILEVLRELPLVRRQPAPICRTVAFDEHAVRYQVRYFLDDFLESDGVTAELHTRLWYRLRREGIGLPVPQRLVHLRREGAAAPHPAPVEPGWRSLLDSVDLFAVLGAAERERLGREVVVRHFGQGEHIIEEGDSGHTFYLVAAGTVSVRTGRGQVEVAQLGRGQYFGEMSLLTGEKRSATVVAVEDSTLLELDRPVFARLFGEHPRLARQLSALLAQRRQQLRAVAETSAAAADISPEEGHILGRLRQIFGLAHHE